MPITTYIMHNEFSCTHVKGTTLWRVLTWIATGNLGTYATVAAAATAGKELFPPDGRRQIRRLRMRVIDGAGTGAGSPWSYALNRGDADFGDLASDALRTQVASSMLGTDEVCLEPDGGFELSALWVKLGSATDSLSLQVLWE